MSFGTHQFMLSVRESGDVNPSNFTALRDIRFFCPFIKRLLNYSGIKVSLSFHACS